MATRLTDAADFIVANDFEFDLKQGQDIDATLEFQLPPGTILATSSGLGGLLAWNVRAGAFGDGEFAMVTYELHINGNKQTSQSASSADWHTVQEAFDINILKISPDINKIEFRIISGGAQLSIGDVALWFRKQIFDPH